MSICQRLQVFAGAIHPDEAVLTMKYMSSAVVVLFATAALLLGVVTGCGGDDDGSAEGGAAAALTIEMGDYYFDPQDATAAPGNVSITVDNAGTVEHELVIFRTDVDPGTLDVAEGRIDEEALEESGAEEIGELEAESGESETQTFELDAGQYIMICNLEGHYEEGMWGTLTVG
jgi:uncharacterized cupredoxin-like copper-binding protein